MSWVRKDGRRSAEIHVVTTEAQTLDEALKIIKYRRMREKNKARDPTPPTLRQELSCAKFRSRAIKNAGKISLANGETSKKVTIRARQIPLPHPFRDLTNEQKRERARELFATGKWGLLQRAARDLAKRFDVPIGQVVMWLEED